ncbi:carbohydrate ABC transporter permease [Thermotalea metallivorans]|uniref:Lactose transport system permease protein LacF n=1 Tax=Thermotalea metallivorans TaxID=520762 RepID=A0A140L2W5_9FIRM|nr:sugar ABC transporter permease [Thermotalea metallivorans]KXG74890.1 Lactose transport system permease protein LacF [Thermotalea metallivorans]
MFSLKQKEEINGYLFILPAIVVIFTFVLLPIGYSIFLSFFKVKLLGGVQYDFTGLKNYLTIVTDERAKIALWNTLKYVIIVVPTQTMIALILASILNSGIKFQNGFRIIYFLPTLTSSAALTLIFMWMFSLEGFMNQFIGWLGFAPKNWLGDPRVALNAIMVMNIWSTVPYFMTIYLAALQDIPRAQYEAAEIDGASAIQKFLYITVPNLKPITNFVLIMGIIGTFQLFDQSYIFSGGSGGPSNATLTVVLLIYQYAFRTMNTIGYASSMAVVLAIIIMIATIIARKINREESLY